MAGISGFEPEQAVLETVMLPLTSYPSLKNNNGTGDRTWTCTLKALDPKSSASAIPPHPLFIKKIIYNLIII